MNQMLPVNEAAVPINDLLAKVARETPIVIERDGVPVAALVSYGEFERWQRNDKEAAERIKAFLDEAGANANLTEEEAAKIVEEAIREVREADTPVAR